MRETTRSMTEAGSIVYTTKLQTVEGNDYNVFHREDGPAIETEEGEKQWWWRGQLHRIDGPAIEHENGDKSWYVKGAQHRIDGPAFERGDGYKEWWLWHNRYTYEDFNEKLIQMNIKVPSIEEEIDWFQEGF